ncbi:protein GrpE-like [Impatiens glandulifera]|uniref:protein GrpE-like n=1 Tax=Impatiens glandulifera TaxID=253017 RepID=UPI001FB0DA6F|nr:protein GrpE-like [Impatiens glandulifera]
MAFSLSGNFSLCCNARPALPLPLSISTSSKTPSLKTLAFQRHQPLISLSNSSSIPIKTYSRSITCHVNVDNSSFQSSDEDSSDTSEVEELEQKPNLISSTDLTTVINVYKEAILEGDEKTIAEVEAFITALEKERDALSQKFSAFSGEISSGKDKYIRLQADFDNFRKRSEKERLTTRSNAQGEVIESLLPLVDSFERAKHQLKPESEKEKKIDNSYQGIYKQFVEIMRSISVAAVPTVGKPFDPSVHEAIAREQSLEFKEGIVMEEVRRGFILGGRLLRPAMVKVSSGPGNKKKVSETSDERPTTTVGIEEQ